MRFRSLQLTMAGLAKGWVLLAVVLILIVGTWGCRAGYVAWQVRAARSALTNGAAGQALVALRKAEAWAPNQAEVLFLLGRALRRTGASADAHAYLDRAVLAAWPEDEVRHQRYLILVQTGAFDQASGYLSEVMRNGASDELAEEIYEARARGFLSIYDLNEALLCIDYWLKWRPQARQARMWRAEICERNLLWQDAISEYRKVLERDPQDFDARLKLADALLSQHHVQEALEGYRQCAAIRPDDPAALFGIIKCQQRIGGSSDARKELLGLLDRDLSATQKGEVLTELGQIALLNQDYEQAADLLERAKAADPTNQFIYQPLHRAYTRLGKTDRAEQAKRRGDETNRRLARLADVTRSMVKDPQNAELRYEAGMLFIAEGAGPEGVAWLQTALKCDPDHRKTHAALAEYYEGVDDTRAASHHRRMAEESPPRANIARSRSDLP